MSASVYRRRALGAKIPAKLCVPSISVVRKYNAESYVHLFLQQDRTGDVTPSMAKG